MSTQNQEALKEVKHVQFEKATRNQNESNGKSKSTIQNTTLDTSQDVNGISFSLGKANISSSVPSDKKQQLGSNEKQKISKFQSSNEIQEDEETEITQNQIEIYK